MNSHKLHIEVIETSSVEVFKVIDFSLYDSILPVNCPQFLIKPPGVDFTEEITVTPNFNKTLTACDLGIQKKNCEYKYEELPDGIYAIRYSVSPNAQVYVEYNHLRMTQAKNELAKIYCDLDLNICLGNREKEETIKKIQEIELYLSAAKSAIEACHETNKGLKMYERALTLLDKLTCKTC